MRFRVYLLSIIIGFPVIALCQNQNTHFHNTFFPKIKEKLYALYPNATNVYPRRSLTNDTTEEVDLKCNCPESSTPINILFDTNGNILNKQIIIPSTAGLPSKIKDYINDNGIEGYKLREDYMIESINNKGEISYSVNMIQSKPTEGPTMGNWYYILKFKSSGEFISKEKKFMNF